MLNNISKIQISSSMRNCFFNVFLFIFSKTGKKIKNVNYNVLHIFLDQLLALNSFLILISLPDQKKNIYQQKKKMGKKTVSLGKKTLTSVYQGLLRNKFVVLVVYLAM